jgi:putative toxin-antitoxin system antitoxin component (TIGR02293 family)
MSVGYFPQWLTGSPTQLATTIGLLDDVCRGLPLQSVDALSQEIAPGDATFKYALVPKATYNRRRVGAGPEAARLSQEQSERLVRLARIWAWANEVWQSPEAARRFMFAPHMLLEGRTPIEVTLAGELGGKMVEDVLGRLAYGSAA